MNPSLKIHKTSTEGFVFLSINSQGGTLTPYAMKLINYS